MRKIMLEGDFLGSSRLSELMTTVESESPDTSITIDLSGVKAVDYEAIAAFLSFRNTQPPERLVIQGVPDHIQRLVEIFRIPI